MVLSRKGMTELEKLIADMSSEQFRALYSDICDKLFPEMTLEELTQTRDKVDDLIRTAQEVEREKFVAEARAWAERAKQMGFNLGDALGITPQQRRSINGSANGSGNGKIAVPLYINPEDPTETFSGRGRRATWLVREMAKMGLDEKAPIPDKFHNPERK